MSNRSFLIQSDACVPISRLTPPVVALAAGNNCVPVYWFSLFDEKSIVTNQVTLDDGRVEQYPYLITSAAEAVRRLSERRLILDAIFPPSYQPFMKIWMNIINGIEFPFVHLDAAELWMMIGAEGFQSYIYDGVRAYDSANSMEQINKNDLWLELFDVAQIDFNDTINNTNCHKLIGYPWKTI